MQRPGWLLCRGALAPVEPGLAFSLEADCVRCPFSHPERTCPPGLQPLSLVDPQSHPLGGWQRLLFAAGWVAGFSLLGVFCKQSLEFIKVCPSLHRIPVRESYQLCPWPWEHPACLQLK